MSRNPHQSKHPRPPHPPASSSHGDRERGGGTYTAQSVSGLVNDPREQLTWWGFQTKDMSWKDPPPPLDPYRYPNITRQDLERYLSIVGDGKHEEFLEDRRALAQGHQQQLMMEGEGGGGG